MPGRERGTMKAEKRVTATPGVLPPARLNEQGAANLLDVLDAGVLALTPELTVVYANARWSGWIGASIRTGAPIESLLDEGAPQVPGELQSVLSDGEPRTVLLTLRPAQGDAAAPVVSCIIHRTGGGLLLEAAADGGRATLEDIARRLAEVTEMDDVLGTLCELAVRQCAGTGAAVLRVQDTRGEVVAAVGDLAVARGRGFDLEGSLLREAMAHGDVVGEENYHASGRPLMRAAPELALGPVLMSPLHAHGETIGVLAVARGIGGQSFRPAAVDRLRVLADHAALAVHKSALLFQAQSADRAKSRFLATMSHELRTPLTALAGYNELLVDQVIGPISEAQQEILERMHSVTMHLSSMIEEILSFTSLEEGRDLVRPSEFLAADLVRAVVAVVQPMADQKKLPIQLDLPKAGIRVTNDIDKSRQILVNLLGNAVKFTDRGHVQVKVTKRAAELQIDVTDTGIGISADELSRLFRPFTQVDGGLTRRHGGTGLGLYISRHLATMLGGRIEVVSEPGVGSTFTVVLPLIWDGRH